MSAQGVLGVLLFIVVCIGALVFAYYKTGDRSRGANGFDIIVMFPAYWVGGVAGAYAAMGIAGCAFWVMAWIGIILRHIVLWLLPAVWAPFQWIFG